MLNRCSALVFSADGRWSEAFCANLISIGFMRTFCVNDFESLEQAISRHHINYCFFSQSSQVVQIRAAINAIRTYKDDDVRFSPIILMAKEISKEELRQYIGIGFDDIVQFPCTFDMLRTRAKRQLNNVIKYYETADYFGPDRRNFFGSQTQQHEKRNGLAPYKCLSVRRDVFKGVEVVDVFDHKPPAFAQDGLKAI
ncbi:hypothetical protein [Maritalea porphyrae]|uniref:hypothetical protein n=1 Tax=Maritalea porphyrae TaxID=880732 RepID=UPI0022AFCA85|nr:hypothetical protein [Maritalea porphyrae]MCZ4273767.1 hypothetical protein [Maritalea porphyrae]